MHRTHQRQVTRLKLQRPSARKLRNVPIGMALSLHRKRVHQPKTVSHPRLLQKCCATMRNFVVSTRTTPSRSCWNVKPRSRWIWQQTVEITLGLWSPSRMRKARGSPTTPATCHTCTRTLPFDDIKPRCWDLWLRTDRSDDCICVALFISKKYTVDRPRPFFSNLICRRKLYIK